MTIFSDGLRVRDRQSTPGLAVMQVTGGGGGGFAKAVARISNIDAAGVERADAHGIALRMVGGGLE